MKENAERATSEALGGAGLIADYLTPMFVNKEIDEIPYAIVKILSRRWDHDCRGNNHDADLII